MKLPAPRFESEMTVESAMLNRRSVREFADEALTLAEISQLLWAAQGVTHPDGYRTAPSAGALYPLETYLIAGNVADLAPGLYRYICAGHTLDRTHEGDRRAILAAAALGQSYLRRAPASIAFAAVFERTTAKYGARGMRYVHMDVGHAAQNLHLQAVALGLGSVVVGAFDDEAVRRALMLPKDQAPLCIMPVGRPAC